VLSFVDCINRGDLAGLGQLMTDDHRLEVFDEAPLIGRDANLAAWRGYAQTYSTYVIYPGSDRRARQCGGRWPSWAIPLARTSGYRMTRNAS
jgi:hypothetical protein